MSHPITPSLTGQVQTKANVYFDGKCVSHTVELPNGTRKSVGVILPATLNFGTGSPEVMEIVDGECKVKLKGEAEWKTYTAGESFSVPGHSSFDIEAVTAVHYICHFG